MARRWIRAIGRGGALALLIALAACAKSVAPAAMLDMRSLPDEQDRRNERLDSTAVRPGPENRKPLPDKLRYVETAAAKEQAIAAWERAWLTELLRRHPDSLSEAARRAAMSRTHLRVLLARRGVRRDPDPETD